MNVSAWCIRNPIPSMLLFIMLTLVGVVLYKIMERLERTFLAWRYEQ